MFNRNPPTLPSWPRWRETPQSITIRGLGGFRWTEHRTMIALAITIGLVVALAFGAYSLKFTDQLLTAIAAQFPEYEAMIIFTAILIICGSLFLLVCLSMSPRFQVRFSADQIQFRKLWWRSFWRNEVGTPKFFVRQRQVEGGAVHHDVFMRLGLNEVRLITLAAQDKARNVVRMCRLANDASLTKQMPAFEVVTPAIPIDDDLEEAME